VELSLFFGGRQVVKLDQDFGSSFSGVLVSGEGRLRALWASFSEQARNLWLIMKAAHLAWPVLPSVPGK
jgi:hypothetical protein